MCCRYWVGSGRNIFQGKCSKDLKQRDHGSLKNYKKSHVAGVQGLSQETVRDELKRETS